MRRIVFLLALILLAAMPLAAQTDLTDEQQALRDELREAFENRDSWDSYSRSTQDSTRIALTVIGTDTSQWRTDTITVESTTDIDREAEAAQGRAIRNVSLASSEGDTQGQRTEIEYVLVDGDVFVAEGGPFVESSNNLDAFTDYQLAELVDLRPGEGFEIPVDILDNATEVYDLGVRRNSRRRDIQSYEVLLDFSRSLPLLDLDLDSFLSEFNGIAELGALSESVIEGSSLRLIADVDSNTGQLTEATLVIEIGVELEGASVVAVADGDGRFTLELSQETHSAYFNINDDFDIEAP
jgi:hypothetical protein